MQLRSILKAEGIGKQGHTRSASDNARALLHIHSHQQHGLSYDASVKATATAELSSPSTLRAAVEQFTATGTLRTNSPRTSAAHPFYTGESGPSLAAELILHRLLHNVTLDNTFESSSTLRTTLAVEANVVVSKSTVLRWLHSLGYVYGNKHFVNSAPSYRFALIRHYIYTYAKALKEQEGDRAIIVFMDESYIHAHHCTKQLWYSLHSPTNNDVRGDSAGKRIIIMHAMTKDGLLEVEGTEPSNILTELYHSCALIFDEVGVDGITPADYHDTINGEKFIGWIQTRLLPTVGKMYPGKKMYLVLDNAKYHHHRGPDWFSPCNKKKGQLADFLRQREVVSITVEGERVIPSCKFSADARSKAGGPTLEQLKVAVKAQLTAHPDINTTVPQQLLSNGGHELIYTPPYVSELQPIELIWAFTKALVARQSIRTRNAATTTIQTRAAMSRVTAELCGRVITHCHKWMEQFMKSDQGGSLQQFVTLQALVQAPDGILQVVDVASAVTPIAGDDADESSESPSS